MFSWVFDWTLYNDIPDWKTLEEGIQAMAQLHPLVDIHLKCLPLLTKSSKAREGKQQNHKHREKRIYKIYQQGMYREISQVCVQT